MRKGQQAAVGELSEPAVWAGGRNGPGIFFKGSKIIDISELSERVL